MLTPETFLARYPAGAAAPGSEDAARLIAVATAWMEKQTDRIFGDVRAVDTVVDGNGKDVLWLVEVPLEGEGSDPPDPVTVYEAAYRGAAFVLLEPWEWVLRGRYVYRVRPALWWRGREYLFRYLVGYAPDTGPADVREAVAQVAEWLWNQGRAATAGQGIRSERLGDYQYTLGGDGVERLREDIPFVFDVIASWRRVPV